MRFIQLYIPTFIFFASVAGAGGQEPLPLVPLSAISFITVLRTKSFAPDGRAAAIGDCYVRHYTGNSTHQNVIYRFATIRDLLESPRFDVRRATMLYIHGYVEYHTDTSVRTVIDAYARAGGYNVLMLDWSNMAYGHYLVAATNVMPVGRAAGAAFHRLLSSGLAAGVVHVVGHSLGAHVAATMGRYLKSKNHTLYRITGLDPALPGFYPPILGAPLSRDAAAFVDVVHTDSGQYGGAESAGHADFWPNGGRAKQPGCMPFTIYFTVEDFCSHWRSWTFWAESVTGGRFLARRCDSYDSFLRGSCSRNETTHMGLLADTSARGNFYLLTAARRPFALGDRGAG